MIWFSCFCCPSENFRLTPAAAAESWIDLVLAVRQPLSAPTCAKPSVSASGRRHPPRRWIPTEPPQAARPRVSSAVAAAATARAASDVFFDTDSSVGWTHSRMWGQIVNVTHAGRQPLRRDWSATMWTRRRRAMLIDVTTTGSAREPAMVDVARLAGVSHQTVSRVLNNHPNVRQETARRVRAAIAELELPAQPRRPGVGHRAQPAARRRRAEHHASSARRRCSRRSSGPPRRRASR